MAHFTQTVAGNSSNYAIWDLLAVPGVGDTVTSGYELNIDSNWTIGDSPTNTTSQTFYVTGTHDVTVAEDVAFIVNGNIFAYNTGRVILGPGASMLHGSTAYRNVARFGANCILTGNGTAAKRCTYGATESATKAYVTGPTSSDSLRIDADYIDFYRTDTFYGIAKTNGYLRVHHGRWLQGEETTIKLSSPSAYISLQDCYVAESAATESTRFQVVNTLTSALTGTFEILRCIFADKATFYPPKELTCEDCVFLAGHSAVQLNEGNGETFASFSRNISSYEGQASHEGGMVDCYMIDDHSSTNPKTATWRNNAADHEITGTIFDHSGPGTSGDLIGPFSETTGDARYPLFHHNIMVPNCNGYSPGKFVSFWQTAHRINLSFEHNTYPSVRASLTFPECGFGLGEIISGDDASMGYRAGMITSFRSNMVWAPDGLGSGGSYPQGGLKMINGQSQVSDMCAVSDADYNFGHQLTDGSYGNGYHSYDGAAALFSSGTPDEHGGTADPQFVDPSRNLATWDRAGLGNTSVPDWSTDTAYSVGDIVSSYRDGYYGGIVINYECIQAHTSDSDSAATVLGRPGDSSMSWRNYWRFAGYARMIADPTLIADLVEWVTAGFAPTNSALQGVAHDSGDIGAVAVTAANNTATVTLAVSDILMGILADANAANAGTVAVAVADIAVALAADTNAANAATATMAVDDIDVSITAAIAAQGLAIHTILDFANAADLGHDSSGNGHDWTLTGASQSGDTPTNNFATLNALRGNLFASPGTLSDGNTTFRGAASVNRSIYGSILVGFPFYFEVYDPSDNILYENFGIGSSSVSGNSSGAIIGNVAGSWGFRVQSTSSYLNKWEEGVGDIDTGYAGPISNGDVLGLAVDPVAGKMWVRHNGTWILSGDPATGANPLITFTPQPVAPGVGEYSTDYVQANFGATDFVYAPPEGFLALNSESMDAEDYDLSGSYVGNGNPEGPSIYTGCALESVTIGGTTYTNDGTPGTVVMFTSCGFKLLSTTHNANGTTYNWTGALLYPARYANAQ